jgi:CHASE2 domain-containing sensor protein/tRNA A-37 threonylcarbamoyl transferase component Bud32
MKQGILKKDWFVGLIITLVFLAFMRSDFVQSIERDAYDFGVQSSSREPSDKIAIIAIDDESIENMGRWPWSRSIHAEMHKILTESGAKVIGQTVFFTEPQLDPGLVYIRELKAAFQNEKTAFTNMSTAANHVADPATELLEQEQTEQTDLLQQAADNFAAPRIDPALTEIANFLKKSPNISEPLNRYIAYLDNAEISLDTDSVLSASILRADNVVLAMPFIPGNPLGRPDTSLPEYIRNNKLTDQNIVDTPDTNPEGWYPLNMVDSLPPITSVGQTASNIGALVSLLDIDGGIRSEPLVINYYEDFYPSMALILAAKSLNLGLKDIKVIMSSNVQLGKLKIKTDQESLMNTFFYSRENQEPAFPVDSFYDVIQGKIPASKYKNKIVLIGATAIGVGNTMVTPINAAMSPVVTLAHSVSSILNEDFFIQPAWGNMAQLGLVAVVALYLMMLLPKMGAATGFIFTAFLFLTFFVTHYIMMTTQGMWIQLMTPALLLVVGHILLTTKRFLLTEKGKERLDIESAESNRMLGLSMQGQGQLDMAFEKFRKLSVDKSVLELMYNLALDYERKRQFNKAKSVYDHITEHNPKFRDVEKRSTRATAMDETVMLGGGGASSPGGTLLLDDGNIEKPMLGRYEIERELGKGAMGAVYLGKDPKISRVVAIKTMALSQEFEEDELEEVKERFFREAETAGRLNHPSIVTIFDAGDEQDLAYIAMEYLKGSDLAKHTKKDNLLPIEKVLSLIQRCADGLNYAHGYNVVHRDIKPANIMWDPETDQVKITDFGIARITDSSKTKTGMVLGTPSYMSPEQLAGKKVEGQSDLFSLGVMLFQMLTGTLPFTGDSMASLMFKIANEMHPDPKTLNPDIPDCVVIIINKALEKEVETRYSDGTQMSNDLLACLKTIGSS